MQRHVADMLRSTMMRPMVIVAMGMLGVEFPDSVLEASS